jgi:hypothetical protein
MPGASSRTIVYAALRERDDLGRDGTFAPERRALDRPMAIACLRFLCSPCFRWRISVSTIFEALGPYLRPELFFRDDDLLRDVLRLPEDVFVEPDLLGICILPCFLYNQLGRRESATGCAVNQPSCCHSPAKGGGICCSHPSTIHR